MQLIEKYFDALPQDQKEKLFKLEELYTFWNNQINVISRKDTDNFYERHVLHSLAIAKIIDFKAGTKIMDIGTGGGFPGIPLAIIFPKVDFLLVDSIGKKIKVVNEVAKDLELSNVRGVHARAEEIDDKFDFIVSRAVTKMPKFLTWTKGKFLDRKINDINNGILYLKGGDLSDEMRGVKKKAEYYNLNEVFDETFFDTKKVVHVEA